MKSMFALAIVLATAGLSFAGEGHVAGDTLAKMGLTAIDTMSDAEGQAIRGQGTNFTYAYTVGASAVPGAFDVSRGLAVNPNVSLAVTGSQSAGFYNVPITPPMTAFAGSRGFAFAAR